MGKSHAMHPWCQAIFLNCDGHDSHIGIVAGLQYQLYLIPDVRSSLWTSTVGFLRVWTTSKILVQLRVRHLQTPWYAPCRNNLVYQKPLYWFPSQCTASQWFLQPFLQYPAKTILLLSYGWQLWVFLVHQEVSSMIMIFENVYNSEHCR